jgi:hypothetical protein
LINRADIGTLLVEGGIRFRRQPKATEMRFDIRTF